MPQRILRAIMHKYRDAMLRVKLLRECCV